LKPVAWRKKNPVTRTGPACQAKLLVAQITQSSQLVSDYFRSLGSTNWGRTDSGTSYRLSKSGRPPCPAEWHPANLLTLTDPSNLSTLIRKVLIFSTKFLRTLSNALHLHQIYVQDSRTEPLSRARLCNSRLRSCPSFRLP